MSQYASSNASVERLPHRVIALENMRSTVKVTEIKALLSGFYVRNAPPPILLPKSKHHWTLVKPPSQALIARNNDIEASHTSLRLFYDREDSPVVSVDQVSVDNVNIETDMCELKCVTCDKNLGDKLDKFCENYCEDVWMKVNNKYRKSRDVDKLNFIVSHPHGCSKQVSVGHWVDRYEVGDVYTKFTYTTCTCPGSSGAMVHCVGYEGGVSVGGWLVQLVHSGSLNSKLNYSGAGYGW
ncbi:hypothetical protein Btru_073687 [Bulinus truncatus]|nr:hypothetical protein Btru_073687 [Bulinus truncatus]